MVREMDSCANRTFENKKYAFAKQTINFNFEGEVNCGYSWQPVWLLFRKKWSSYSWWLRFTTAISKRSLHWSLKFCTCNFRRKRFVFCSDTPSNERNSRLRFVQFWAKCWSWTWVWCLNPRDFWQLQISTKSCVEFGDSENNYPKLIFYVLVEKHIKQKYTGKCASEVHI